MPLNSLGYLITISSFNKIIFNCIPCLAVNDRIYGVCHGLICFSLLVIASTARKPTQLTIKGRWLEAFGFTTRQPVIIDAQQGLLIIRIEELS